MAVPVLKDYIGGEWVASLGTAAGEVRCPATGELIASVPLGTAADVDRAVKAAREAFWEWRSTPPLSRARYLFRMKEVFEEHFEEIARVLTREQGKALDESRGEVRRLIENVEHATGVTTMLTGYGLEDIAKDIDCQAERQPVGVFAAIAPYNFPANGPLVVFALRLVSGNTFLLTPSEQVPMTQARIFELLDEEVMLPPGVVNLVNGAREVVNGILEHPDIAGVSFVGSTPTARHVYARCGATGKRVQALGGAKNCVVVLPDAVLDKALPSLITSFFGCSGQRCLSGSILVPVGAAYQPLKEKFLAASRALRVGDGLDESNQMGPLVSAAHRALVLGYIEKGLAEGAELCLDGRDCRVAGYPGGFWVGPTVFDRVTPAMTLAREEVFGPVVSLMPVPDLAAAIELVNTRGFANAACLYTQSGPAVREFKYRAKPSMVGINLGIAAPMSFFPFGGAGHSMFGDLKAHGREIFQFFTDAKVVITRWL